MRVTQGMLANNSLRQISSSYGRMGSLQDQLSTGKKINRPSDDPVVAMKGMQYRTNLTEVEQYKRNLSEAYQWMENSEGGIEHTTQVVQRARELLLQAKNGSNSPEDVKAIGVEIEQLKKDLQGVANTQVAGRYIFNGTKTDSAPVDAAGTFNPAAADYKISVSKGVELEVNVNALEAFGGKIGGTGANLFQTLQGIVDDINTNETMTKGDQLLSNLDEHFDKLNAERAKLGARYNRLELIDDRIGQQEVTANRILSDNEDADIERVITDLKMQESIHRAALSVSSRIIQPTLMDFLR
ncbi:flagellar hook-associated protein FlgL [Bacillus sp. FJAT-42376]|uniref:flagellar hook-associated protein FlgL n=1 Tax=Bacillus sp. FJAT-42376 TaxID=2014076 RepID=UPI000F50C3A6|nr:flagellar hook-associated protein FlgL [Bacillus sp. FJAT-42376]AZB44538.1 flagellar hook-associated protein FlgL [Bacillus sp. FJAT-42376]